MKKLMFIFAVALLCACNNTTDSVVDTTVVDTTVIDTTVIDTAV